MTDVNDGTKKKNQRILIGFILILAVAGITVGAVLGTRGRNNDPNPVDEVTNDENTAKVASTSWPTPYDPQPTLSSSDGKLEISLHLGVTGEDFNSTPNFVSKRGGFEGNVLGYSGCFSSGERCEDVNIIMGGPTLRVKPGDDLIVHLYNDMPKEKCKTTENIGFWNDFHQPMNTNLHVHGLLVTNEENNVLQTIYPGTSKTYNIKIREVQQGGTHWYHPHAEGAVGLQAGGGAIGLLIVEDLEGDIPTEIASLPEIGMRIQHTEWKYQNEMYAVDYVKLCKEVCSSSEEARAVCGCNDPETECIEPVFGVPAYKGNYSESLTVNGAENPAFDLVAGQWYHLRTLYAPTYKVPIEPTIEGCDFKLLSKDGRYIPVAPRDIQVGYMFSGSRADFLVRCNALGSYSFESIDIVPRPHNWAVFKSDTDEIHEGAYGQKLNAWTGIMATFNVIEPPAGSMAPELDEIRPFRVARPCYAPEMRDVTVDDRFFFLQGSLVPPYIEGEPHPVFRKYTSDWSFDANDFYAINDFEAEVNETAFPGRLRPPKGSPVCDGKITNEFGECYGTPPPGQHFYFNIGDIVEIDYYAPQIHPLHPHVFGFQITQLPTFSVMTDYFKVGDYHDVLIVPIEGDGDYSEAQAPEYGKVVFRQHIYKLSTDIVGHCHFYRHSDRGMVVLGTTNGTEGLSNPQVEGTCYHGLSGREFEYE